MNREGAKDAKLSSHLPEFPAGEKTNGFLAHLASWRFTAFSLSLRDGACCDLFDLLGSLAYDGLCQILVSV